MKLRPEHLAQHLERSGLGPLYLIHGDEPLLAQEALDTLRDVARQQGLERQSFVHEPYFDWGRLSLATESQSLFAGRRLIELRLNSKPDEDGRQWLSRHAQRPVPDLTLVISCGKLDGKAQKTAWFTALEQAGIAVQVFPVPLPQLPDWISRRMHRAGLQPDPETTQWLARRVEGNLLAAVQEIEKLRILLGPGPLTADKLEALVADSARYTVYDLADAAVAGKVPRVVTILNGLRSEGLDPVLVLWALHREVALLARLAFEIRQGRPLGPVFQRQRVFDRRQPLYQRALRRLSANTLNDLLRACAHNDRVLKGMAPGRIWDELLELGLRLAGGKLAVAGDYR